MNASQCRMARAGLCWTITDLSEASGVTRRTIIKLENDGDVQPKIVAKLQECLERKGVTFIERGVYVGGVVPPVGGC